MNYAILLETGDYLLQETGNDRILLENYLYFVVQKPIEYLLSTQISRQVKSIDLTYAITISNVKTKDLVYKVITSVTKQKPIEYKILSSKSIAKDLKYAVYFTKTVQKEIKYGVVVSQKLTKSLLYRVEGKHKILLPIKYAVDYAFSYIKKLPITYKINLNAYTYFYSKKNTPWDEETKNDFYLLKENGEYLLLENFDKIEIEQKKSDWEYKYGEKLSVWNYKYGK